MEDNKPVKKLTPEEECIQSLSAILAAVHFETTDSVTKQFINMMVGAAAAEYQENTKNPLVVALFTPPLLTKEFRKAIALMRAQQQEALERGKLFHTKNGSKKQ